ncbi:MAG: TLD domain-containing protein [archaeon]|nr:TLD domain-containing protein [archaeon]
MKEDNSEQEEKFVSEEEEKKKNKNPHPYRKYQFIIFLLLIVTIINFLIVRNFNEKLTKAKKDTEDLENSILEQKEEAVNLDRLKNFLEVNYISIHELHKMRQIDTIKTLKDLYLLKTLISNGNDMRFFMCYKATKDGDNGKTFKHNCANTSPILVIIETVDGFRFGGFATVSFSDDENIQGYREDEDAFIFSFDTEKKYKIIKTDKAIFNQVNKLPIFGENDIVLKDGFLSNESSYALFPKSFEDDPNAPREFFLTGGKKMFRVKEMEAYFVFITPNENFN